MIELQQPPPSRSDSFLMVIPLLFTLIFSFFIISCNTDKFKTPGKISPSRFIYELRITTTESYSSVVNLHEAQIRINGQEQSRIAFIAGTRIIEVPFQYIQTIRFSNIGASEPYAGSVNSRGGNRIRMEIFAEGESGQPNGVTITCDSIPDFYVIGQESRYVKRVLQNNRQKFEMQEIRFLQMTDLAAQPKATQPVPVNPELP